MLISDIGTMPCISLQWIQQDFSRCRGSRDPFNRLKKKKRTVKIGELAKSGPSASSLTVLREKRPPTKKLTLSLG